MRMLWVSFLLAVVLLGLTGCSTLPSKASDRDCLVVMKTEVFLPKGFVAFVVREPGVMIDSLVTDVSAATWKGDFAEIRQNILVPYEPGRVLFLDQVVVEKVSQEGKTSVRHHVSFRPLSVLERADFQDQIRALPEYASWVP